MRYRVDIIANGHFLPESSGGHRATENIRHALRSIREFANALDGFEDATREFERVTAAERTFRESHSITAEDGTVTVNIPISLQLEADYWRRRKTIIGKIATLSMSQFSAALVHLETDSNLPEVTTALVKLDEKFPALQDIRNSIAHVDERMRSPMPAGSPLRMTNILAQTGYCNDEDFIIRQRANNAPAVSLSITDDSFRFALNLLQNLCDSLPWEHPHTRGPFLGGRY